MVHLSFGENLYKKNKMKAALGRAKQDGWGQHSNIKKSFERLRKVLGKICHSRRVIKAVLKNKGGFFNEKYV